MDQNVINSCTGNSWHVNIHYLFQKHRGYKKEITLEYCPTYHMIANYFTKPLQGKDFNKFCDMIMIYYHVDNFWLWIFQSMSMLKTFTRLNLLKTQQSRVSKKNIKLSCADVWKRENLWIFDVNIKEYS